MKKHIRNIAVLGALMIGTFGWIPAQTTAGDTPPDRAVVPLSNPSQPAKIEISVMRGSVTVRAVEGREIIVESRTREKALSEIYGSERYTMAVPRPPAPPAPPERPAPAKSLAEQEALAKVVIKENLHQFLEESQKKAAERRKAREKKAEGLKLVSSSSSSLSIEESDNTVRIRTSSLRSAVDVVIQAPASASLEIRSMMDGTVHVEGISGEIDINNLNGPVTVRNVSGHVLVHTVNGDIDIATSKFAADKPLSFSTMSGDIDVTLPANAKASLRMKTDQGEIYTGFDMVMTQSPARHERSDRGERERFRITFDRSVVGAINGGGPEISLTTFSGNIYIRKGK
jgi:hypothetical protein